MAVRKTGGRFTVEFQQGGIRVFRRLPAAATKAQAQEIETKLRREIIEQVTLGHTPDLTLEKAVDLWLADTLGRKRDQRMPSQNADHLRPFLSRTVREAADAAREARTKWLAAGLSAATVNRRLAVLKASLRYAYRQGWTDQNYGARIEMLPEPPPREVYLTPEQVKALASKMETPEGKAAVLLLAYTGLRAGELLALTTMDIESSSLLVRKSKSGKPRTVPLPPSRRALLSALPLPLSYSQLQWQFRAARAAAGLPQVRLHDLRHTFASMLINAGVDLFTVGKLLGHGTPGVTARYSHLAQDTLRKAVGKLK